VVACSIGGPVAKLFRAVFPAADASDVQQIITLVQMPSNPQISKPEKDREPVPYPQLVHDMNNLWRNITNMVISVSDVHYP
jgi:hypothetical protein